MTVLLVLALSNLEAQDFYPVSSGELLFQFGNVGFIYDENLPQKTVRRSYTLGIPLALKLGSFKNHIYVFGGGEFEMLFHYKTKFRRPA